MYMLYINLKNDNFYLNFDDMFDILDFFLVQLGGELWYI